MNASFIERFVDLLIIRNNIRFKFFYLLTDRLILSVSMIRFHTKAMFKNKTMNIPIPYQANIQITFAMIKIVNIVFSSYLCRKFILYQTNLHLFSMTYCFEINFVVFVVCYFKTIASQFYTNSHRNKHLIICAVSILFPADFLLFKK